MWSKRKAQWKRLKAKLAFMLQPGKCSAIPRLTANETNVKIMMKRKTSLSVLAGCAKSPIVKTFAFLLLLGCIPCCFGQVDTNLIAIGDWSEAISSPPYPALRGRLLVYDEHSPSAGNHARVYLELQHVFQGGWANPVEVYFEFASRNDLHFEMRNQLDQPIRQELVAIIGPMPNSYWVTLPCESTVRVRADMLLGPQSKPAGLEILVPDGCWIIPPNATNDFYLSATFTPPKDHPSPLHYHVWQGTLKLPKVKIPVKKPG